MKLIKYEKDGYARRLTLLGIKFNWKKNIPMSIICKYSFNPKVLGIFVNPFYFARKALWDNIKELSSNCTGNNLLDIGCRTKPYKNFFKIKDYIGMEHEDGKAEWKQADVYYDGKNFPFKNNTFENVVSFQVFEHVFEPETMLDEIYRVLKPKGKMLLSLPLVWDEHEQPYDFGRYTSFGIKYLLEKHGFEIIEIKKTVTDISLIFQLINDYIYKILIGKGKPINHYTINILCSISNILGIILAKILPPNNDLYLDNIILAKKREKREK